MRAIRTNRRRQREAGIALLISIFVLLLIGVVAIALVVSSGTESALVGNYRSSTGVYYAALAGVEEARARLRPNDPNSFKTTNPSLLPPPGTQWDIGYVDYILNPGPNDNLTTILTDYPDKEYDTEFGPGKLAAANGAGTVQTTPSIWNSRPLPFPAPLYKWVRINAVSETSMNLDVDSDGKADSITPLYYDYANRVFSNNPNVGPQALELTALAALPNGSQKLLQYLVAPAPITLPPFLAALTLSGNTGGGSPTFHAPANNAVFAVKGNDQCNGNPTGSMYAAIGLFGPYGGNSYSSDLSNIVNGIPAAVSASHPRNNYTGLGPAPPVTNPPDVEYLATYPTNMESPAQLDDLVTTITENADVTLPSNSTGADLTPLNMSSANPLTIVVNGNLDISNWSNDGYGLLLVKGTFTYDPDTNWNGIVLVIGQGIVLGSHMQYKQINGAMLVAKTRDAGGNLLASIGGGSVSFDDNMQGNGVSYSSCWIQRATPTSGYKILSFHEISQ